MNRLQNFIEIFKKLNKCIVFLTFVMFVFVLPSFFVFAQNYQFSLVPRRAYDQIHIEVWAKSLNANAPKLGHSTLVVQYNKTFLEPSQLSQALQNLSKTDTIASFEANSDNPIQTIVSDFNAANGYSALGTGSYSNGFISLEINLSDSTLGLQPKIDGKGSFLGRISLNIIANPSETDLANINWSRSSPGETRVFDISGNDINSSIQFINPDQTYKILGITLLSPNQDKLVIDRDANYKFITNEYADGGYPIYFERSVNPALYPPPIAPNPLSEDVAYSLQYSLNGGTTWLEIGRVAETSKNISVTKTSNAYKSGDIFEPKGGSTYFLTTQSGTQINTTTFRQPLRVIWTKDPQYNFRSEQAKIRVTQLNEKTNTAITDRTPSNISTVNNGNLILGRLFFVQLNGNSNYLKSTEDYSNATQLTVSAWINLNSTQAAGSNPAIIASSGGPNAASIMTGNISSTEGAWMLYLKDGRIPAFRAREILGRGDAATPLYLAVVEAYERDIIPAIDATVPLSNAHSYNWVHLAATVKDNTVSLYVNGDLAKQVTNTNANDPRMLTTEHPIWIGVNPNAPVAANSYLNAGIKNVQIWRIALTQDQIRTYAAGISKPDVISSFDDIKRSLELYFPLEGTLADLASNVEQQKGRKDLIFYASGVNTVKSKIPTFALQMTSFKEGNSFQANGDVPSYRPDQAHIKITSPAYGSGILNTNGNNTEIRWLTYGMLDINNPVKPNYEIEYSIDNGDTWTIAKDPGGKNLTGNNISSSDLGKASWQPYQNNTPADANLRTINPYVKNAKIRISGIGANGQTTFTSVSDSISIAPHFAIKTDVGSILQLPPKIGMNINGDYAYIEAWIKPYRFPNNTEGFFPIVQKSNGVIHYSFRLNPNGTLSFIVTDINGTVFTARTSTSFRVATPNGLQADSAWTHVGVLFIKSNSQNISEARFYIDGNLQGGNNLAQQFNQLINLNGLNEYPLYIGSSNGTGNAVTSFVGEIKEVRFWNNVPNNLSVTGTEPTAFSAFVQKAQAEVVKDLKSENKYNLHSYFSMEGGTFVVDGNTRVTAVSEMNGALLNNYGTPVKFVPVEPFIKLVEPFAYQSVANTDTNVRVRWVGLYYDGQDFTAGLGGSSAAKTPPSLEYSLQGGGGAIGGIQPYQYVGSLYWGTNNKVNSIKLPKTSNYYSDLSLNANTAKYIALSLDVSKANPDLAGNGKYEQGPLTPTLTNARLRLKTNYTINGEKGSLQSEGDLFTITPSSNFIVRIMLEGYHQGSAGGRIVNQLGTTYERGGLRVRLFKNNSDEVGAKTGSDGISFQGYTNRDPANLNKGTNQFGNVEFIFTDVSNGSYWLLVDHINHLPVMSRYPVPFQFVGEGSQTVTWAIKSGWDFMSWNGRDDNVMKTPSTVDIWSQGYYTAKGYAKNTPESNADMYAETALIYNGGSNATTGGLAGMVGGDVNKDDMINSADRVKVRQETGLQSYESDVTGDRYVNALDRTIVDKNFGKVSSLNKINIPPSIAPTVAQTYVIDPFNSISEDDVLLSKYFNKMAELVNYNLGFGSKLNTHKSNFTDNNSDNINVVNINNSNNNESNTTIEANNTNTKIDNTRNTKSNIKNNNIKTDNAFQAVSYQVSATVKKNDTNGFVDLSMYIKNKGDEFAPANCTFSVSFDPEVLDFVKLLGADSVLFNSTFDYSELDSSKIPDNGYLKLTSAPNINKPNAYNNIRSIEIDYDAYANIKGINVPIKDTYLGTLRFKIKNGGTIAFKWHESKVVITTKGQNITNNGDWIEIPPILLYNVQLTKPVGGENYAANKKQLITWQSNGSSEILIEFSSNSGATWSKVNTNIVHANDKQYDWNVPNIKSNNCLIRILDAETKTEMSRSDSAFSIVQPFGVINKPYISDTAYLGGKTTTIEWIAGGTDCIKFEFSSDGGTTWSAIAGEFNPAKVSKTNWTIPKVTTKNAMIRMLDCETKNQLAITGRFIILAGSITFTQPINKQVFKPNEKIKVTWKRDLVEEFDLYLTLDAGRNWEKVESNVDATKLKTDWIAPDIEYNIDSAIFKALYRDDHTMEYGKSGAFRIRITKIDSNDNIYDDYQNNFRIVNIFPNPIKDIASLVITLNASMNINIRLIDMTGATVEDIITNQYFDIGQHRIDFCVSELSSGRYFIILSTEPPTHIIVKEINIVH